MSQLSNAVLSYLAGATVLSTDRATRSPRRNGEWLERILRRLSPVDAHGVGEWGGVKERCIIVPAHSPTDWYGLARSSSQDAILRISADGKTARLWSWIDLGPGLSSASVERFGVPSSGYCPEAETLYLRSGGRGGTVAEIPCGILGLVPVRFRYAAAGER